ncbi:chromosome maintenance protein [Cryptosporidium felis]|nr:chromosome maintenance protein [Cryptosporidium felis]
MPILRKKGRVLNEENGEIIEGWNGRMEFEKNDFVDDGTLISIELENWMNIKGPTKYCFNPGINIVTGLNGSGKSSVACGIAISLGYDTGILARGHYLSSYIRNGSTSSRLQIVVRNGNELENGLASTIERVISIVNTEKSDTKGSQPEIRSTWRLNGKKCLERDITTLRKSLNIQLDNMVAFLAQQRVSHFATQTPEEIFIDTLRIVSNESLKQKIAVNSAERVWEEDFEKNNLLSIYNEFLDITKNSKESRSRIQDTEMRLSQLENEISKSKQNEKKYVEYLYNKMGIHLIHFFQSLSDVKSDREGIIKLSLKKEKISLELEQSKNELKDSQQKLSKITRDLELTKTKSKDLLFDIQGVKLDQKFKAYMARIDQVVVNLEKDYKDLKSLRSAHENRINMVKGQIEDTKRRIELYESQLNSEWKPKLETCKLLFDDGCGRLDLDLALAEQKKRTLEENIGETSFRLSNLQRKLKEFEYQISQLKQKKHFNQVNQPFNIKEKANREKYLSNVNREALNSTKKENIIRFFNSSETKASGMEDYLPKKKVIGPIGSYISVKNPRFQVLVETFLQQFHYYFVAEREDVKLLTERYRLNVLTLSSPKIPIYPKVDSELREIGISGFLHEYLSFEDEKMKNILYQISTQFFICVVIDYSNSRENRLKLEDLQEDELLYKLSDWFRRNYDVKGNRVSNNIHLFVISPEDSINGGTLYKLVTSIYNQNSKTVSMVKLGERMNTVLLDESYMKTEGSLDQENSRNSEITPHFQNQRKDPIDEEIENQELAMREAETELASLKEQYEAEHRLLKMIMECVSNIPQIQGQILKLRNSLQTLEGQLEINAPNEAEIRKSNAELVKLAFFGQENRAPLDSGPIFKYKIGEELEKIKKILIEISTKDFVKNREFQEKINDLALEESRIQRDTEKKRLEIKRLEHQLEEITKERNHIISGSDIKRRTAIDSYLQFYSTYCRYNKRQSRRDQNKQKKYQQPAGKIYEYFYKKTTPEHSTESGFSFNQVYDENVPGAEFFSCVINGTNVKSSYIPLYCIEIIWKISSDFGLLSDEVSDFKHVLDLTLKNGVTNHSWDLTSEPGHSDTMSTSPDQSQNRSQNKSGQTLFDLLLEKKEYQSKYTQLFRVLSVLEEQTHDTNLERLAEMEQELDLLKQEAQELKERMRNYENFVCENHSKWIEKLEFIETVVSGCFGTFMRFVNERHTGKVLIPLVSNFRAFESDKSNKGSVLDFFIDNFEAGSKLNIMVRFGPDEDLRQFSSSSISGGEQSLCTILFILSLQVSSDLLLVFKNPVKAK